MTMLNQLLQRVWGQSAPAAPRITRSIASLTSPLANSGSQRSGRPLRTATYIKVTSDNDSKYYEMRENEDATFDAYYGWVGGFRNKATHPITQWDRKIREKKSRGYIDQTQLLAEASPVALFESLGLLVGRVTDSHVLKLINRMMGPTADQFDTAFSVRHTATDALFDACVRQQKNRKTVALWHNNPDEDWLSALKSEPTINLTNTADSGRSATRGIHFVDRFNQLDQPLTARYLAIYEVHIGEQLDLPHSVQFAADSLQQLAAHYDSVVRHQSADLPKQEVIIYNPAQCTIRYIVKLKA
ncbi:hypothetical protein GCM10028819_21570 [Spirosoma humi]